MLHPHVPEELQHFGKHLFATFLGLLMALGLESCHQSHLHAKTAAAARAFLARELELNRADLKQELESLRTDGPKIAAHIKVLQQRLGELPATPPQPVSKENFALRLMSPRTASWDAAMATQAFSHMEPWRVEKIAQAFTLQRELQEAHALLTPRLFALSRLSPLVAGQIRPEQLPAAEAAAILGQLREAMIALGSAYGIAKQLDLASEEALQACR